MIERRAVAMHANALLSLALTVACGGDTTGSSGGGGSSSTGGGTGTGGAGGSLGMASVEFTVVGPATYCHKDCMGPPSITVTDSAGRTLGFGGLCRVQCDTCMLSACPPVACQMDGPVTGATLNWDGSYSASSTCGPGTECLSPSMALPGRYTATFCATPGTLTGPDGGFQQCVTSGPAKCAPVEFDFPSTGVVRGTLGP